MADEELSDNDRKLIAFTRQVSITPTNAHLLLTISYFPHE